MDRMKLKITDFILVNDYPLWENYRKSKFPNRHIFDRVIVNNKANVKRPFRLKLMLYYDDVKDEFTIGFNGSIRKWYFGSNTRKDLNYSEFLDCIKLLSIKIGLREIDLWKAKITQLESGITLLLKSYLKGIMNCLAKYRNFSREIEKTTLYFKGKRNKDGMDSNYKIKCYEKNLEMNKNNKSFFDNPIKMNVLKKFLFLRTELDVKKVSGVNFFKEKANTLEKIKNNWNEINLELIKRFEAIQFVDLISEEKVIDVTILGKRDYKKYMQFENIKKNGFYEELEKFELTNLDTNKTKKLKAYFKNYEMFLDKRVDFRHELLSALKKKMDRIYNKSNI